jgi:hypothetical protein
MIEEILKHRSVSIVGMAKNTGKTECLNHILHQVKDRKKRFAVTSIGIDGEGLDQVTQTAKPEIEIYEGMFFITSEKHYRKKRLTAEIVEVSEHSTAMGRLITAQAVTSGKALLSGPSDTKSLKLLLAKMERQGVDTTFVDGALSRLSLGSPSVTDALVLTTGAAVSKNIPELLRKTRFVYDLICEELVEDNIADLLRDIASGMWAIDEQGELHDLDIPSVLLAETAKDRIFQYGNTIFAAGAVSDGFLQFLRMQKQIEDITLIVKDFTKIFASSESYYAFLKKGGRLKVVLKSKLLGVCVNPQSPDGFCLDSIRLREEMQESLGIPVYDIKYV